MGGVTEERIVLPAQVTSSHTYELLEQLGRLERAPARIEVDASGCEFFGPLGTALLAATIARRVKGGRHAPDFIAPVESDVREYLEQIDFQRFAAGRGSDADAGPQAGTLEMRQLTALDPVYVHQLADLLAERVPGTGEVASDLIARCLNELLQNVFEWAYETPDEAPIGCFVLARWFRQQENVRLAVVDAGIGIPARHLTIVSHAARVVFMGGGKVRTAKSPPWRGTAIEIDFRPDMVVASSVERIF